LPFAGGDEPFAGFSIRDEVIEGDDPRADRSERGLDADEIVVTSGRMVSQRRLSHREVRPGPFHGRVVRAKRAQVLGSPDLAPDQIV